MPHRSPITNALTIDVEDYFQVSALAPHFPRERWDSVPCRIERNVDRVLELLDGHGARGTFYVCAGLFGQGARSADAVGMEFPGGKTLGDTNAIMLRFDPTFMQLAADGKL